jgi:ATP:ADP antiporter, AAA family
MASEQQIGRESEPDLPLSRILGLKKEEISRLILSALYFFFLLAAYYILRPIRDQAAVAGGVHNIPWLFTATLTAMLLANPVFSALVVRFSRKYFIPIAYRFFTLNILIFFFLFLCCNPADSVWAGRIFYIWTSVFNLFVVSIFWAYMADTFSPEDGKRLFGLIAVGGTAGGIAGSLLTATLSEIIGPVYLLLISALFLEASVQCFKKLLKHQEARDISEEIGTELTLHVKDAFKDSAQKPMGGKITAGISNVVKSAYLSGIAGFILLYTVLSTFLYFQQAQLFEIHFTDAAARTAAFARVDLAVNTLTLLTQLFLTGKIIKKFGVGISLAILPMVCILGFSWMSFTPGIVALITIQVLRRSSNYAVSRPARETLFTVLSRENKYKAKSFIDTFVYRLGDQVGAWSWAALSALGLGISGISLAALPLSAVWISLALWLGKRMNSLKK